MASMSSSTAVVGGLLWEGVKGAATVAGKAVAKGAKTTKLHADIALTDRNATLRKYAFGVELYDYVVTIAAHDNGQTFYTSNDLLWQALLAPFIESQKEVEAAKLKRAKIKEDINMAAATRAGAFPKKAETIAESLKNAGKSASLGANEAKLQTELALIENNIKHYKHEFGIKAFVILSKLEDEQQYLPPDRNVRSMYDATRRDIEKIYEKRDASKDRLKALRGGGGGGSSDTHNTDGRRTTTTSTNGGGPTPYPTPSVPTAAAAASSSSVRSYVGGGGGGACSSSSAIPGYGSGGGSSYGSSASSSYNNNNNNSSSSTNPAAGWTGYRNDPMTGTGFTPNTGFVSPSSSSSSSAGYKSPAVTTAPTVIPPPTPPHRSSAGAAGATTGYQQQHYQQPQQQQQSDKDPFSIFM